MEIFEVNILGCGSAKPTLRHLPTCQIVNIRGKYYMIDCGEGAQIQMQKMSLPMARIGHIFISHNHGDHVFGLPGLISTMALLGRTAELHIHGPQQLQEYLDNIIRIYCEGITFQIIFHPIDTRVHNIIYKDRRDLCQSEQIHKMLQERIDTLQQQLAHYEQIKRFTLLPHHFSMEKGELTNTLKIKRRVLNENYRKEIDAMYAE